MWKLLPLAIAQSILLSGGQVVLKFALNRIGKFEMTRAFWAEVLTNKWFLACGVCYGAAALLWVYILRNFPFSTAYPITSLSYVFGMVAAVIFFQEEVSIYKWIGVIFITGGCFLIIK